jgi:hypothetical protein
MDALEDKTKLQMVYSPAGRSLTLSQSIRHFWDDRPLSPAPTSRLRSVSLRGNTGRRKYGHDALLLVFSRCLISHVSATREAAKRAAVTFEARDCYVYLQADDWHASVASELFTLQLRACITVGLQAYLILQR